MRQRFRFHPNIDPLAWLLPFLSLFDLIRLKSVKFVLTLINASRSSVGFTLFVAKVTWSFLNCAMVPVYHPCCKPSSAHHCPWPMMPSLFIVRRRSVSTEHSRPMSAPRAVLSCKPTIGNWLVSARVRLRTWSTRRVTSMFSPINVTFKFAMSTSATFFGFVVPLFNGQRDREMR